MNLLKAVDLTSYRVSFFFNKKKIYQPTDDLSKPRTGKNQPEKTDHQYSRLKPNRPWLARALNEQDILVSKRRNSMDDQPDTIRCNNLKDEPSDLFSYT